jgi:hypothetical protein
MQNRETRPSLRDDLSAAIVWFHFFERETT